MHSVHNVVFRDVSQSPSLAFTIEKKLKKLDKLSDEVNSSRVVIETPHQHKHKGKLFRAHIELSVKGSPITVHQEDTSVHVAVRDAFRAAERKLKQACSKRQSRRH